MKFKNSCDGFYSSSLDVRFTKSCDNNCPFCIEKNGICSQGVDVGKMIESTLNSEKETVLILGGEPFLEIENLRKYVLSIRNHVEKIYITTSLPKTIADNWFCFKIIMELIDGLNISLQHYDWKKNNDIMRAKSNHNRIELLEEICSIDRYSKKCRISINLVKGQIDTKEKIDLFLRKMEEIGVRHIKINELQNSEDLFISFEKTYGIKLKSPYSHGCQTDINLPYNMRITLKRACFCVNENLDATISDFFKAVLKRFMKIKATQVVMYESGMLSNGWMQT